MSEVIRAFDEGEDLPDGYDELGTGVWSLGMVPEGVMLQVGEKCEAFDDMLSAVAAGLERRSVEGSFDVYDPRAVQGPPIAAHLLECRLRVRGERYHRRFANYGWRPDPEALWEMVVAGERWCADNDAVVRSLMVGTLPATPVGPGEDPAGLLRDAIKETAHLGIVELASVTPERFRSIVVESSWGRVSLIEGHADIENGGWRPALDGLTGVLQATSDLTVYGFIKRGSNRQHAAWGMSLAYDWPQPPHFDPTTLSAQSFEASYAPDAFAVQLLGPGYAGRVPTGAGWRQTQLAAERVILEHPDLGAWFDTPFAPFGGIPNPDVATIDTPEVLTTARADFAPILFREDIPIWR